MDTRLALESSAFVSTIGDTKLFDLGIRDDQIFSTQAIESNQCA